MDSHLTSQPTQPLSVVNELHHSRQHDLAVLKSNISRGEWWLNMFRPQGQLSKVAL